MRRAAVSVPSNIAEGQARQSTRKFLQFLSQAMGSLAELETQLRLSERLGHCTAEGTPGIHGLIADLDRMLKALRRSLAKRL
jgi:four helix bundle protein